MSSSFCKNATVLQDGKDAKCAPALLRRITPTSNQPIHIEHTKIIKMVVFNSLTKIISNFYAPITIDVKYLINSVLQGRENQMNKVFHY